jgi:hypothetical protein
LPNKIGYLLGLPTKKLDLIIYYERYVVIQAGVKAEDGVSYLDFLTEEEYLAIWKRFRKKIITLMIPIRISLFADGSRCAFFDLFRTGTGSVEFQTYVTRRIQKLHSNVKMKR